MSEFWKDKIRAFLHDPPDKAIVLFHRSHIKRRDAFLNNLGLKYNDKLNVADYIASAMQRINVPKQYRMDNANDCKKHICFKGKNYPLFKHILSGKEHHLIEIVNYVKDYGFEKALESFGFNSETVKQFYDPNDWKKTFFLLWRYLPEKYSLGYFLPADTRIPDHSIWDHLDVTSAISSSLGDKLSLFAAKILGVQEFISNSRRLSDLWASSHIFSMITFSAINAIVDELGPDVIIYPQLRGMPILDTAVIKGEISSFKLSNYLSTDSKEERNQLKKKIIIANFPNVFLAFVPYSKIENISSKVKIAIKEKWIEIAEAVIDQLNKVNFNISNDIWLHQINSEFELVTVWHKILNYNSFNDLKEGLPSYIVERQDILLEFIEKPEMTTNYGHFYQTTFEIIGLMLAQKSRFWNQVFMTEQKNNRTHNKKCLMCGRKNAIVLRTKEGQYYVREMNSWKSREIKEEYKHILKEGERLCSVCLVKRLYGVKEEIFKKFFKEGELPTSASTVHVAAREFIKKIKDKEVVDVLRKDVELVYKHEWKLKDYAKQIDYIKPKFCELWENKDIPPPNKYYAILMIDGDRIGKMLLGETLVNLKKFLHPAFEKEIEKWKEGNKEKGKKFMGTKRILTPSYHIGISRAMKDFSLYVVPHIIQKYDGFLIYAGGDDVMALFSTNKVLEAAYEIQEHFKKDFFKLTIDGKERMLIGLGHNASMSAGIVFAHYKWPLQDAIERARKAEKKAKNEYNRNAFCVTFIKRSGEIVTAGGRWHGIQDLVYITKLLVDKKISHNFIYDFNNVCGLLTGDMLKSEVKRLIDKRALTAAEPMEINKAKECLIRLIENYNEENMDLQELSYLLKVLFDAYVGGENQ